MLADPVTAFFIGTLLLGLVLVAVILTRTTESTPPVVPARYPIKHVRITTPERIGACANCGKSDVPVQLYSDSWALDPEDHCNGCIRGLAGEPVVSA